MMENNFHNNTANNPVESYDTAEESMTEGIITGTIEHLIAPSNTAYIEKAAEQGKENLEAKFLNTPVPTKTCASYRGKSIGAWSIHRRRASRKLLELWKNSLPFIGSPSFAVYINGLINEIENQLPLYRNVPNEDVFSGILQLVKDALTGNNFMKIQDKRVKNIITETLDNLSREKDLTLVNHQNIQKTFMQHGLDLIKN